MWGYIGIMEEEWKLLYCKGLWGLIRLPGALCPAENYWFLVGHRGIYCIGVLGITFPYSLLTTSEFDGWVDEIIQLHGHMKNQQLEESTTGIN